MKTGLLARIGAAILVIGLFIGIGAPTIGSLMPPSSGTIVSTSRSFDGKALYNDAFEKILALHLMLDSPEKIDAFRKEWEHKFDNTGELATEEGADKAVLAMMQSFGQRFDYFFDVKLTKDERERMNAQLSGIGAVLRLAKMEEIIKALPKDSKKEDVEKALAISADNALTVEETMEGSPAESAGILAGDIIRAVNGKDLAGSSMEAAVAMIKGNAGTSVTLGLERAGKLIELPVTRAQVKVPVVKAKDLGDGISHIKLNNFESKYSVAEMAAALKKAAGGKGIVLDLRGNPGGDLRYVLAMAAMILEDGPVMVKRARAGDRIIESEISLTKNFAIQSAPSERDPSRPAVQVDKRPEILVPGKMPIVILIDEGSASASEILSGALQHNKRAFIMGKPSHGKGVGQTVVPLPFGRSLHITSFEFIPGRTPNDWYGVIPDQVVERGKDRKVDLQLDAAREKIKLLVKEGEEMAGKREENLRKHQEEFKQELEARKKAKSAP